MFRDRNGIWRVKWREDGKQRTKSFPSKQDAALFEAQLKKGVSTHRTIEQETLTFSEYAARWVETYLKVKKSESTWENDQTAIARHLNPVIGGIRLVDLKKRDGLTLQAEIAKKVKPKTVNNVMAVAKKILETAVDYELLSANPFQKVKPLPVPEPEISYWTVSDRDRFLKRCYELKPELADLVLVAAHTGLRKGELRALKRENLDFDLRIIHVGDTWNERLKKPLGRTKNRRRGYVPMNDDVYRVLATRKLMKPKQSVFRSALFGNFRRDLQLMCEKAKVPVITVHDLRHTFASTMAMAGTDPMKLQKFMRHETFSMTQRYAHLHPDSLKGGTDAIGTQMVRNDQKNVCLKKVSS